MKFFKILFAICIPHLVLSADKLNFPSDIQKCAFGDEKCIIDVITFISKYKITGEKGIDLESLSPLLVKHMDIKQGAESPVNIDLKFTNNSLNGLETGKPMKIRGFTKDLKGPHELYLKADKIALTGPYSINGKVLILPIRGEGISNITIEKPTVKVSFTGKPLINNNKTYLDLESLKIQLKVKRVYVTLTNLFNGDKVLGDNMNKFLNENWLDIYIEMKDSIERGFGEVFYNIVKKVFLSHPYNEMFLQ